MMSRLKAKNADAHFKTIGPDLWSLKSERGRLTAAALTAFCYLENNSSFSVTISQRHRPISTVPNSNDSPGRSTEA